MAAADSLNEDQFKPQTYSVVTAKGGDSRHAPGRLVTTKFDNFEDALAHGKAHTPDTDWGMLPNLPDKAFAKRHEDEYEQGLFHHGVSNRYGAIFANGRRF